MADGGPQAMLRQLAALPGDLPLLTDQFEAQCGRALSGESPSAVWLVGDGDSYHAGQASQLAFEQLARLRCHAVCALRFSAYTAPFLGRDAPGKTLVIAASASGSTPRVVDALQQARRYGARTLALTGKAASAVVQAADHALVLTPPQLEAGPGLRTFQATLFGYLSIALFFARQRGAEAAMVGELRRSLAACPSGIADTSQAIAGACATLARSLASSNAVFVLGSGPSQGTAAFAAAKLVEAAGVVAIGQDVEEWWHVERFALPKDLPVVLVVPPGASRARALEVATGATRLGRRVAIVGDTSDVELRDACQIFVPVSMRVNESLSPLVYHLFGGYLACELGQQLQRWPFQATPGPGESA